jgi:hypothetical protein
MGNKEREIVGEEGEELEVFVRGIRGRGLIPLNN